MNCRFCGAALEHTFVDLGVQPLSNSYVEPAHAEQMEPHYPLHVRVCQACFLVQLPQLETPERIFGDYAYLSSASSSWLEHCRKFSHAAIERFGLDKSDLVVEVASNDGYLLKNFVEQGFDVLGIEPARNVAVIAEQNGVPSLARFFGTELADELVRSGRRAKLLIGNNVLAHVPDINDFVQGLSRLLAPGGVLSMEFPHLLRLVLGNQFDTIYHEHFSYLSLGTVREIFGRHGLRVFEVEEMPTHGGSLRVYACPEADGRDVDPRVGKVSVDEERAGLRAIDAYRGFTERVQATKRSLLEFLIRTKRDGRRVVGYGAPAKGNTLLNYCGIRSDFLDFTVDKSPLKQGKLLPGTRIPILAPEAIDRVRPDFVLILPWNLRDEIVEQMAHVRAWGGKFVVPIPEATVLP